jgi:hypothetical protein
MRRSEPGRAEFCCSGCALASRLPRAGEGGQFPVTPALVIALGAGFALFNQVLFWVLSVQLAGQHRAPEALICARVSGGVGIVLWAALVAAIWRTGCRRWTDVLVMVATLGALAAATGLTRSSGNVLLVNATLVLWLARGWGKQKFAGKKSLTI